MYYLGKLLMRIFFWCVGRPALLIFEFIGLKKEAASEAAAFVAALSIITMVIVIPIAQWIIFRGLRASGARRGTSAFRWRLRRISRYAFLLAISLLAIVATSTILLLGFVIPVWPVAPLFLLSGSAGIAAVVGELVTGRWRWPVRAVTMFAVIALVWWSVGWIGLGPVWGS
jgi:hypothetical protein